MTVKEGTTTQDLIQNEAIILTKIDIPHSQIIAIENVQMINVVLEFFKKRNKNYSNNR